MTRPDSTTPSCARCGAPLPVTRAGVPKTAVRYCSSPCRVADVRDRRAAARENLCRAVAELQEALQGVRRALQALGLPRPDGGAPQAAACELANKGGSP